MSYKLLDWIPIERLDWKNLSTNNSPGAIALLKANMDKINWTELTWNQSPDAIQFIFKNPEKIDWEYLSQNSYAMDLIL